MIKRRFFNPAMVVALLALFVALSGTAVAAGVVPLAKRALIADNASKLQGKTAAQVAALAPPVSSVGGLVTTKTAPWSLGASQGATFTVSCDAGQKATGGGFDNPNGDAIAFESKPGADGASWSIFELNISTSAGASGTVYVECLK